MIMNKALTICVLLVIIASTGCERAIIIDDILIISTKGYDLKDGLLQGSAIFSTYAEKDKQDIIVGEAKTVHSLFMAYNNQTHYPIEYDKTMVVVIGHHLAKKGLSDNLISSLHNDQRLGSKVIVVVSNQEAKKILQVEKTKPHSFLYELLKQNIESNNTPHTNLHSLLYQYFGAGQDVYLPCIKLNPKGLIEMDGMAIFHKDRMKLHLNPLESTFLKLLVDDNKIARVNFPLLVGEKTVHIFAQSVSGNTKMNVKNQMNRPQILFKLSLNCIIADTPLELNLSQKRDIEMLQKAMERFISKGTKDLLTKLQKNNVDPVGIADFVRGKDRDWEEKEFMRMYPDLQFVVDTEVKILQTGVGE